MPQQHLIQNLKNIILENISNEQFGVADLAEISGMSRSTLLRKIQKESGKTVTQFIKDIRLEESLKLVNETDLTISEISFKVGFNSTSYFIKCFKEVYDVSPGEYNKQEGDSIQVGFSGDSKNRKKKFSGKQGSMAAVVLVLIFIAIGWWVTRSENTPVEKSIAVLPFKNDSNDTANIYIVNGLMDAILNNLQKIKDLKVISRTSVEKYRNSDMTISEIAEELGVSYFVEGSAQKINDQIMLNVQLIDGVNDRHIWAEQYHRKLNDIFDIQSEVSSKIAYQVEAKITSVEQQRINEIPTQDMLAYDYFLQGLDLLYKPSGENLSNAILLFTRAIEIDTNFARAYAATAMSYYYLDIFQVEKKHVEQINYFAEKAYLIDPQLSQSLVAKAFSYMITGEYKTAVTYFEKALEYHPNSAFVINFLSDFYTNYFPNTEKYLEYALRGMQLDKSLIDSTANSYLYLHVSNAFLQTGFLTEALQYINQSLEYDPQNIYSMYVKAYVLFAKNKDLNQTKTSLIDIYAIDTTRLDVVQELAKTYYSLGEYESAYPYYRKLLDARENQNLYLFLHENIKIAYVCRALGYDEEAEELIQGFKNYAENDHSIYQPLLMSGYYAYQNDNIKALQQLQKFSDTDGFHIWTLFLPNEPYMQELSTYPEFIEIMDKLNRKFEKQHQVLKDRLTEEELI